MNQGQEKQLNKGNLEYNIAHVSNTVDLSPRHSDTLTAKRGKPMVPLQVKTKRNKGGGGVGNM